jgi:hypothetical protein
MLVRHINNTIYFLRNMRQHVFASGNVSIREFFQNQFVD